MSLIQFKITLNHLRLPVFYNPKQQSSHKCGVMVSLQPPRPVV